MPASETIVENDRGGLPPIETGRPFGGGDGDSNEDRGGRRSVGIAGVIIGMLASTMTFVALAGTLILAHVLNRNWVSLPVPKILWPNTALLLLSSVAIEFARHALNHGRRDRFNLLWWTGTVLGAGFLAGQTIAWIELRSAGVYMATNQSHSLFYVLTITHAAHAVGALIALLWVGVACGALPAGAAEAHRRSGHQHLLALSGRHVAVPDGPVSRLGMIAALTERAQVLNRREKGLPLLLVADAALFACLLTAYLIARAFSPSWPRPLHFPSGLMTVTMIMFGVAASFSMRVAVTYSKQKDFAMTQRMLALALVGWGTFLFLLSMEWARLYFFEHVELLSNPWNVPALGISYYGLTGLQAAHVLAGCVWLFPAARNPARWRLFSLELFVGYVNALFLVIAFLLIFSSMDLSGF